MDVIVKGRRTKVSAQVRQRVERKLARLARKDPRVEWVEVELIRQPNPRVDGGHRVEAACRTARRTFRATGTGPEVEAAVDLVVGRLERQLAAYRGKRRSKAIQGANRVKSGRITTASQGKGRRVSGG